MATQRSDLEVRVIGRDELSPQFDKLESRLIRFVGAVGAGIAAVRLTAAPITAAAMTLSSMPMPNVGWAEPKRAM